MFNKITAKIKTGFTHTKKFITSIPSEARELKTRINPPAPSELVVLVEELKKHNDKQDLLEIAKKFKAEANRLEQIARTM